MNKMWKQTPRWIANWCPTMELPPVTNPAAEDGENELNPCWRDVDLVATKIQRVARATATQVRSTRYVPHCVGRIGQPAGWNDKKTPPLPAVAVGCHLWEFWRCVTATN